jgi:hypothetical protein
VGVDRGSDGLVNPAKALWLTRLCFRAGAILGLLVRVLVNKPFGQGLTLERDLNVDAGVLQVESDDALSCSLLSSVNDPADTIYIAVKKSSFVPLAISPVRE